MVNFGVYVAACLGWWDLTQVVLDTESQPTDFGLKGVRVRV